MNTINAAGWVRFLDRCSAAGTALHSVIARRDGEVIVRGFGQPWGPQHHQLLYSLSKTFTSAAVGLAVAEGALGYDDRFVDIFPDQAGAAVGPKMAGLRVRDALAMASGHTEDMYAHIADRFDHLPRRSSIGHYLRMEPEGTPGVTFAYNQVNTWLCARAVLERTGRDVLQILQRGVFPALGITQAAWGRDAEGTPLGFSGLHLRPDDLSAFVQLLVDNGRHHGEQVLAPEWVENYSQRWVETAPNADPRDDWAQGYGWQVWRGQHGHRGDGACGQYAIVVPEHRLGVAITSATADMQPLLSALWEEVLPGLDGGSDTEADLAELQHRLSGLGRQPMPVQAPEPWRGTWNGRGASLLVEDGELTWVFEDGEQRVPVGLGTWREGSMVWGELVLRVASSLEAAPQGQRVVICVVNTPHTLSLELDTGSRPGAGEVRQSWDVDPLGGLDLRHLAQRFTS